MVKPFNRANAGFTVLELLIAAAIFTVLLISLGTYFYQQSHHEKNASDHQSVQEMKNSLQSAARTLDTTAMTQDFQFRDLKSVVGSSAANCLPPSHEDANGHCVTCTGGKVWDSMSLTCKCVSNQVWNGSNCVCAAGMHWDSNQSICTSCPAGQGWDSVTHTCTTIASEIPVSPPHPPTSPEPSASPSPSPSVSPSPSASPSSFACLSQAELNDCLVWGGTHAYNGSSCTMSSGWGPNGCMTCVVQLSGNSGISHACVKFAGHPRGWSPPANEITSCNTTALNPGSAGCALNPCNEFNLQTCACQPRLDSNGHPLTGSACWQIP